MKTIVFSLIALLFSAVPSFAQEEQGSGIYGYTSIDYDPDSNSITAYSETDVDSDLTGYYSASCDVSVYDNQGIYQNPISKQWSGDNTAYAVTSVFNNSGAQMYTAYGYHTVELLVQQPSPWDGAQYVFSDPFNFLSFSDGTTQDYGGVSLFGPGPVQTSESSSTTLASTYDQATVVIPATCGDVRDILVQEYRSNHSPFIPGCADFMYDPSWQSYGSYYTVSELIGDQSTGAPNYSVLQAYAYATGLNYMSDNINPGSTAHLPINSGYRNPAAEIAIAHRYGQKAYMNSRHLAGDAVDITTRTNGSYDRDFWGSLSQVAHQAGACVEPADGAHFHGDWRTQTGSSNTPEGGNSFPYRSTTCPSGW